MPVALLSLDSGGSHGHTVAAVAASLVPHCTCLEPILDIFSEPEVAVNPLLVAVQGYHVDSIRLICGQAWKATTEYGATRSSRGSHGLGVLYWSTWRPVLMKPSKLVASFRPMASTSMNRLQNNHTMFLSARHPNWLSAGGSLGRRNYQMDC